MDSPVGVSLELATTWLGVSVLSPDGVSMVRWDFLVCSVCGGLSLVFLRFFREVDCIARPSSEVGVCRTVGSPTSEYKISIVKHQWQIARFLVISFLMLDLHRVMLSFYFPRGKYICAIWWHGMRTSIGIPMGINCAPLIADWFLYCYEKKSKRFDSYPSSTIPLYILTIYSPLKTLNLLKYSRHLSKRTSVESSKNFGLRNIFLGSKYKSYS